MTKNAKQIIFNYLRKYKPGDEFHSYDLKNRLLANCGIMLSDVSVTRYIREYRILYGVDVVNVKKRKMLYRVEG